MTERRTWPAGGEPRPEEMTAEVMKLRSDFSRGKYIRRMPGEHVTAEGKYQRPGTAHAVWRDGQWVVSYHGKGRPSDKTLVEREQDKIDARIRKLLRLNCGVSRGTAGGRARGSQRRAESKAAAILETYTRLRRERGRDWGVAPIVAKKHGVSAKYVREIRNRALSATPGAD